MIKIFLFVHFFTLSAFGQIANYSRVLLDDASAVCLDGSPGAYYISHGTVPERVLLFFEGGGWCGAGSLSSTIESCYQRSFTNLGSSRNYPPTLQVGQGILSQNQNNDFRQATKVFLKYCDGAGHQGSTAQPLSYKNRNLYFRGNNITIAQLNSLQNQIGLFSKATDIIVSGASAGGLAVFLWADYITQRASAQNIVAVPDSGIFLDSLNIVTKTNLYRDQFANLFKVSNQQSNPPTPDCLKKYPTQPHRCMFAQYLYSFIKTPIFAIESLYDSWSIPNILGIKCINHNVLSSCSSEQLMVIEEYHWNTTTTLFDIAKRTDNNGFWAPACVNHVYTQSEEFYSSSFRIPAESQNSADSALLNWVIGGEGHQHRFIDLGNWPSNKPCSGVKGLYLQSQK